MCWSPRFSRSVSSGGRVQVRLGHETVDRYLEFLAALANGDLSDGEAVEGLAGASSVVGLPATADLMAKMAGGLANDLASTLLMATDTPVLIAPAMNVRMWEHPATKRNAATLRSDGIRFVGPNDGDMACGEFGPGRMVEPDQIVAAIQAALANREIIRAKLAERDAA